MRAKIVSHVTEALSRLENGAYSDKVVSSYISANPDLSAGDRAEFIATFRGVLENRRSLDWRLASRLRKKPRQEALQAMRLGLFLLETGTAPHAAIAEIMKSLSKMNKSEKGLVNAVLRGFTRENVEIKTTDFKNVDEYMSTKYSIPDWFLKLLKKKLSTDNLQEDIKQVMQNIRHERRVWFRVNLQKWTIEIARTWLLEHKLEAVFSVNEPEFFYLKNAPAEGYDKFEPLLDNHLNIQDISTSTAVRLLNVEKSDRVLDFCAAPGGKAMAMLEKNPELNITLLELDKGRYQSLKRRFPESADIRNLDALTFEENEWDKILLDVPCSGSGSIGHKPDILLQDEDPVSGKLLSLQYDLLCQAAKLLKPGGTIVYSTCSLDGRENKNQIKRFLKAHPAFKIMTDPGQTCYIDRFGGSSHLPWNLDIDSEGDHSSGAWAIAVKHSMEAV
jgi:16S rRNA (cytosine967-C5)-methyltransferase